jgi:threonine/homoserine/homoserine lactone efflux protein
MWCFCIGHQYRPRVAIIAVTADGLATVVHIVIAFGSSTRLIALSKLGLSLLQITDGVFILFMAKQLIKEAHVPAKAQKRPTIKPIFLGRVSNRSDKPKSYHFLCPPFPNFYVPDHSIILPGAVCETMFRVLDGYSILGCALLAPHAV